MPDKSFINLKVPGTFISAVVSMTVSPGFPPVNAYLIFVDFNRPCIIEVEDNILSRFFYNSESPLFYGILKAAIRRNSDIYHIIFAKCGRINIGFIFERIKIIVGICQRGFRIQ